tara:strand:- start:6338 stop:6472 length:135 start_codon:yes stop_codon:yes gene_type:complete
MRKSKRKKRNNFENELKPKIKYNRNKDRHQKHKIKNYSSRGESC